MKKVWRFLKDWVWQFPQHLLALIVIVCLKKKMRSGLSLGKYTFVPESAGDTVIRHENGHSVQSLYLGWFYLLVIGIYSAVFCNLWDRAFHKKWNAYDRHYWYYKTRWTERWADKLGGVDRDKELAKINRPLDSRYPGVTA